MDNAFLLLGLIVLCTMAACDSGNDRGGETATKAEHVQTADMEGASAQPGPDDPNSVRFGPRPGDAKEVIEQGRVLAGGDEEYNTQNILDELEALPWDATSEAKAQSDDLLQRLRFQGVAALIPIRDFLLDSKDSERVPSELRIALIDLLLGLALPEVESVALELLAAGVSPHELWRLGYYLDSVEPEKYASLIQSAAELALMEAEPAMVFPPEFFALLGEFGNENTAVLLADVPSHHAAYASLALASLEDGSGLPILEQRARQFTAGQDTIEGRLALELLAQSAPNLPSAAAALIELARQGVVPEELWPHVLDIVAGNWQLSWIEPPPELLIGSHTYLQPEGSQVIYRVARDPLQADEGLDAQRLFLLDQLQSLAPPELGWTPDP